MCHGSNFPQSKPTKLKSAAGCNILKFISSWNLRHEFGHYREVFKMAHLKRSFPKLQGCSFMSGVLISAQSLFKISLDRPSVGFILSLEKRKSRRSMSVRFFSSHP